MYISGNSKLLHIVGPFWINAFGLCAGIAFLLMLWTSLRDKRRAPLIDAQSYTNIFIASVIVGILGSRSLYIMQNINIFYYDPLYIFSLWDGGLSLLGGLVTVPAYLIWHLRRKHIPLVPMLDLAATYAPLGLGVSRIGCLLAGCCYGRPAVIPSSLSITYLHHSSLAPLLRPLVPVQLYAMAASLTFFCFLYGLSQYWKQPIGLTSGLFLVLEGSSRFILDFFRGNPSPRILSLTCWPEMAISWYQCLSLCLVGTGIGIILISILNSRK